MNHKSLYSKNDFDFQQSFSLLYIKNMFPNYLNNFLIFEQLKAIVNLIIIIAFCILNNVRQISTSNIYKTKL